MKRLLVYLRDYKMEAVLGPLFKLLEASFELIVPLVMAAIIDVGIAGRDKDYVLHMCLVLFLLALVGLVSSVTAQFFAAKAAVGFSTGLRHGLFSHIQSLSFQQMDQLGGSTLITRMTSDINQVQSGVNMTLRLFLRSPFIVFGAMIMAFTVDWQGAMIFVVVIPLLSVVVFGVMLLCMPLYKKVQRGLDVLLGHTRENLAGARVLRAFRKEEEERIEFGRDNESLTNLQILTGRLSALTNPLTYILINLATLAVIWVGGQRVYAGDLSQGQVVALVNYMSQILVELVKLANLIVNITKSLACADRIAEILEVKPGREREEGETSSQGEPTLEENSYLVFDHVSLRYHEGAEEALSDISFRVKKGQTIGIIGGTGSGKSSLVHLIPGFYQASAGRVVLEGKDVKDWPVHALRDQVGIVMQKAVLFTGTIEENLRWGKEDASQEELWQALKTAQAVDVVKGKKNGLQEKIEEGGKNLSGGQKQRLTIARALVKNPPILILDDSASALDFATDAELRKALTLLQEEKDTTIFIVSQRTSSIMHADQILVLDDGELVGIGSHEELLENCQVYKEIYDSQFKKEA